MKNLRTAIQVGMLALFVGVCAAGRADTITTTFAGSDGSGGISGGGWTFMFDLTVINPNGIRFNEFTVNVAQSGEHTLDVYTRSSTYVGFENNAAEWTFVSTGASGPGSPANGAVMIDVADFDLAPGTYGLALVNTNYQAWITFSGNNYGNSDVSIQTGAYAQGLFTGGSFANRTWNGSINYEVIPEPTTGLLILFAAGLLLTHPRQPKV